MQLIAQTERRTGLEPATTSLENWDSTIELPPRSVLGPIRTGDPRLRRPLHYPAVLRGHSCHGRGLNPHVLRRSILSRLCLPFHHRGSGWGTGTRTPIGGTKTRRPAIRRFPKSHSDNLSHCDEEYNLSIPKRFLKALESHCSAETRGFEPLVAFTTPTFQVGTLNHSVTFPCRLCIIVSHTGGARTHVSGQWQASFPLDDRVLPSGGRSPETGLKATAWMGLRVISPHRGLRWPSPVLTSFASPAGVEPAACALGMRCSIQLS